MKIAFVIASLSRKAGGLHESVRRLAQAMAASASSVNVLSLEDEYTSSDRPSWDPVPTEAFPAYGPRQFGFAPGLSRALLDNAPKLVMSHGIWMYPSVVVSRWHKKTGQPYIVHPHGMLDPWAIKNSQWKKRIAGLLYEHRHLQKAACIRALCEAEARAIRAYGLVNPIAIIPNGIDLPQVPSAECGARNSPWHGIVQPGSKVLLYLGRIHPKKGVVNLLKAWAAVQRAEGGGQRTGEWVLAIAGWDQRGHEAELKRLATELGILFADTRGQEAEDGGQPTGGTSLLFLGPQFGEDKAACYRGCDAFILPSFSEGLPMVVLEAWAYGKPVLMTPECNLPEGFRAGAAFRIEPAVENVVRGLKDVMSADAGALADMGGRGRKLVGYHFSWSKIAAEMKSVYEWVLGGSPRPAVVEL